MSLKGGRLDCGEPALEELTQAAVLFRPIHDRTCGVDGWVSLEVSPLLAHAAVWIGCWMLPNPVGQSVLHCSVELGAEPATEADRSGVTPYGRVRRSGGAIRDRAHDDGRALAGRKQNRRGRSDWL